MPDAADLVKLGNAAVVAPAGHGKTEIIAKVAALGHRALILTHTHAGVHALRTRLKRLGVPQSRAVVDTIAGWATRYSHAFPGVAQPPDDPKGAEWDQLPRGAKQALGIQAVRQVVTASYDRILIDEYQDCNEPQHELAVALSSIVPTLIMGDPMQGIFEFSGATLNWDKQVYPTFPYAGTLETPHRWVGKNPDLGAWIAETREKLVQGERIDLADRRITFRECETVFDMGTLFEGIEGKVGSIAAIHCHKMRCYQLAKAARGGYQAIEETAANRLREFAEAWDIAPDSEGKSRAIYSLLGDCFHRRALPEGENATTDDAAMEASLREFEPRFATSAGAEAAVRFLALSRKHSRWKLFRGELWRDAQRAAMELAANRVDSMVAATSSIRQRASASGRMLPKRTVSTPLLLKGLEFDHVIIPDATHFSNERQAQAKLFYVAISRATQTLTISSSSRWLSLPIISR